MNMYINMITLIPIQRGGFEDQPRKEKIREIWPQPRKRDFRIFNISFFFAKTRWELRISLLYLLDYNRVWLEDIFDLSSDFDAPIHEMIVVTSFYSWSRLRYLTKPRSTNAWTERDECV